MQTPHLDWRKTRASDVNGQCVEVAAAPGIIAVRDSKDPDGPQVVLPHQHWRAFVAGIKAGAHDVR